MIINGQKIAIKRYTSKEMKLLKEDFEYLKNQQEINIFYNNSQISFFELLLFLQFLKTFNKKINLTLSYLPYQRMNHDGKNVVPTLNYVSSFLNNLNLNKITIMEPHCCVSGINGAEGFSSTIVLYKKLIADFPNLKNAHIVFTDKGATQRYASLSNNFVYGQKVRDAQGFISSYQLVGDVFLDTAVIVDDIISTGDTILSAVEQLQSKNVKNIYIVAGHFEKNNFNKRISSHPLVKQIYTTNSLTKRVSNKKIKLFNAWEVLNGKQNNKTRS